MILVSFMNINNATSDIPNMNSVNNYHVTCVMNLVHRCMHSEE